MSRGAVVAGAVVTVLFAGCSARRDDTPQALLEGIYAKYRFQKYGLNGVQYGDEKVVRQLFEPGLAKVMIDRGGEEDEHGLPVLDGDPFIDAQDGEVGDVKVQSRIVGPEAAVGSAVFEIDEESRTVEYDLVRTPKGWRIFDIYGPSGSLRELFGLAEPVREDEAAAAESTEGPPPEVVEGSFREAQGVVLVDIDKVRRLEKVGSYETWRQAGIVRRVFKGTFRPGSRLEWLFAWVEGPIDEQRLKGERVVFLERGKGAKHKPWVAMENGTWPADAETLKILEALAARRE